MDKSKRFLSEGVFLREPPGGPEGVRSTERSEPRKVATRRGTPKY
jgi:hypothetical protein